MKDVASNGFVPSEVLNGCNAIHVNLVVILLTIFIHTNICLSKFFLAFRSKETVVPMLVIYVTTLGELIFLLSVIQCHQCLA